MNDDRIVISPELEIPASELEFRFVRSSGPGGQHVNRSATQVELTWDVAQSPSLNAEQRRLVMERLRHLIDQDGILHLASQSTRSQWQNRAAVVERFRELVAHSQRVAPQCIATRPSRTAKRCRVETKRKRGLLKRLRRPPIEED
ncbi:MAG: aminoacyl-tRNA hydrolase [Chloroflexi bacterium]|nr:aminoacyl-tRNA hydrolase [Chloroflexota bacterium]